MTDPKTGKRIHTAIRYGVTQAILDAVASPSTPSWPKSSLRNMAARCPIRSCPSSTQSGDNRYENADKMILKGAQVLPML